MGKIIVEASSLSELVQIVNTFAAGVAMPALTINGDDDDDAPGIPSTNDRDSAGVPWNAQIHSEQRQTNKDGKWRKRKGVSQADYDAYARTIGTASTAPQMSIPGMPPMMMQPGPAFVPPPIVQQVAPQPQQQPAQPVGMVLADFMPRYAAALTSGKLSEARFGEYLKAAGLTAIGQLAERPDLTLQIFGWLQQNGEI